MEAKHQNKARVAAQEEESSKQLSHPSVLEIHKQRDWEPRGNFTFQSSASNASNTKERKTPREVRESSKQRIYKTQPKEWEDRRNYRRDHQARERSRGSGYNYHRLTRDHQHRYPASNGRSYYREISRNTSISREGGTKAPETVAEAGDRGAPLQTCPHPLPQEAVEKALGEVRDAMLVYTKTADPTEREARIERMRQAEEHGEMETRAIKMVRDSMIAEARMTIQNSETFSPERIPATQRLSLPDETQHISGKSSGRRSQNPDSQERILVTQRLGPPPRLQDSPEERELPVLPQSEENRVPATQRLGHSTEISPTSSERVPATMRLGPVLDPERSKELMSTAPGGKRKPGRPPGKRKVQGSPKLVAGSGSRRRTVSQNKPPTVRRRLAPDQNAVGKAKTKVGTTRRAGSAATSATSSENRPICNLIPASSRKRMDFRTPSIPGP